ncbi:MAG: efflux RND transporter periplasmic adaptor subunit, partial [Burkholderiales bacterium]
MSKRSVAIVIGFALVVAVGVAGYFYMQSREQPAGGPSTISEANGRRILYWHDPMFPQQRFARPGRSPFMDMDLVPVYADEVAGEGFISINPRMVQNMGIRTAVVEQGALLRQINTVGYVRADEYRIEVVQARAMGWVERLRVRAVNDPVRKGEPLAEIYSPDIFAAQQEFLLALNDAPHGAHAASLVDAARSKLSLLGLTDTQIQTLKGTRKAARAIAIYSPVNGIVTELGVREGMAVAVEQPLFSLLDLSTVWVTAEIPENQAAWIKQGDSGEVRIVSLPENIFKGKVEYIYPELSENSRTLKA